MQFISAQEIHSSLDWHGVLQELYTAHNGAKPIGDQYFIGDEQYGLFSRGVILPGRGAGLKLASIYPQNAQTTPPLPVEHAAFLVIDETTKAVSALLDGPAITRYKTAADSALAARYLSREDSQVLLVLGSGPVAQALAEALLHIRPGITELILWNRSAEKLQSFCNELIQKGIPAKVTTDLEAAVRKADIITSATSSPSPLIKGEWVRPGTHIDLVGAYRPDMQEADIPLMQKARIFVDDRASASRSGDILIPLESGAIKEDQIEGDLFDICQGNGQRHNSRDITVYKNAGGAHLDLIISQYVIQKCRQRNA